MQTITWTHECYYCHKPILGGKPTLLLSTQEPQFIDISHSSCCLAKLQYGEYQILPPCRLSREKVSFWVHFYPELYKLPGGFIPEGALRASLAGLLFEPDGLDDPMKVFRAYLKQSYNRQAVQDYPRDLEGDFLKFLGRIQKLVKEHPIDIEIDFEKKTK